MAPRNLDFQKFAPKVTNQDKRDRNNAIFFLEKQVKKNCNILGFGSIAAAPIVNIQREITAFQYSAPKSSPLEKWLLSPEVKSGFEAACIETQVWICEKEEKRQNDANTDDDIENVSNKEETETLAKPPMPIFSLNTKEIERFFPLFMESLYNLEKRNASENGKKKIKTQVL